MEYTFNRLLTGASFDEVDARTRKALADKGFGILTEIDVQATMKKKLDVEMSAYRILGACNPKMAYKALQTEDKIGTMLPCNGVLQQRADEKIEISTVDPVASMQAVGNPELGEVAQSVRTALQRVIAEVGR